MNIYQVLTTLTIAQLILLLTTSTIVLCAITYLILNFVVTIQRYRVQQGVSEVVLNTALSLAVVLFVAMILVS